MEIEGLSIITVDKMSSIENHVNIERVETAITRLRQIVSCSPWGDPLLLGKGVGILGKESATAAGGRGMHMRKVFERFTTERLNTFLFWSMHIGGLVEETAALLSLAFFELSLLLKELEDTDVRPCPVVKAGGTTV